MEEMLNQLEKIIPGHELKFELYLRDTNNDGKIDLYFTIFDNKYRNNHIVIYDFNDEKDIQRKVDKIKEILRSETVARQFIDLMMREEHWSWINNSNGFEVLKPKPGVSKIWFASMKSPNYNFRTGVYLTGVYNTRQDLNKSIERLEEKKFRLLEIFEREVEI